MGRQVSRYLTTASAGRTGSSGSGDLRTYCRQYNLPGDIRVQSPAAVSGSREEANQVASPPAPL